MAIVYSPAMMRRKVQFLLLMMGVTLAGCAATKPLPVLPAAMRVPFAGMHGENGGSLAMQDADYPRVEPVALGPTEVNLGGVSTEITYDVERLGPRRDGGYRYRYDWRQIFIGQ